MDHAAAMDALRAKGTEQYRKTYRRHGVAGDLFGVSYAALKDLKKAIKTDQPLAESLWATDNHDARILATMIADPKRIEADTLDAWVRDVSSHVQADALSGLAAATPHAVALMERWTADPAEWVSAAGWSVLAHLATKGEDPDDAALESRLAEIEAHIHDRPNRTRHAMNGALIAIGLRSPALRAKALAAASRIGKVEVDHGETGCKTPDAASYIEKAAARKGA